MTEKKTDKTSLEADRVRRKTSEGEAQNATLKEKLIDPDTIKSLEKILKMRLSQKESNIS